MDRLKSLRWKVIEHPSCVRAAKALDRQCYKSTTRRGVRQTGQSSGTRSKQKLVIGVFDLKKTSFGTSVTLERSVCGGQTYGTPTIWPYLDSDLRRRLRMLGDWRRLRQHRGVRVHQGG